MSISNASCTPYARAAVALPPWGVSLAADGWRPASNVSRADKLQSIIDYYNSTLSSGGGGDGGGGGSPAVLAAARLWPSAAALEAAIPQYRRLIAPLNPPADSVAAQTQAAAEIAVLKQMEPHRTEKPAYSVGPTIKTNWPQRAFFDSEDEYPGTTIYDILDEFYSYELWSDKVEEAFDVCTFLARVMKQQANRARPHQVAALLEPERIPDRGGDATTEGGGFLPIKALSSQTASLPSGHAIQGFCMSAAVYEDLLTMEEPPAWFAPGSASRTDVLTLLYRLAYDVGDRRMIAGVHYASDDYASAELVNRVLGPVLFPNAQAAGMVWATSDETRAALCGGVGYPALCTSPALNASEVGVPLPPPLAPDASAEPYWCPQPPPPKSFGCTYPSAANYDEAAVADDGSCVFDCVADGSQTCADTDVCSGQRGGHCRRLFAPADAPFAPPASAAAAVAAVPPPSQSPWPPRPSPPPPSPLPSPPPPPSPPPSASPSPPPPPPPPPPRLAVADARACRRGAARRRRRPHHLRGRRHRRRRRRGRRVRRRRRRARVLHGAPPEAAGEADDDGGEGGPREVELRLALYVTKT